MARGHPEPLLQQQEALPGKRHAEAAHPGDQLKSLSSSPMPEGEISKPSGVPGFTTTP